MRLFPIESYFPQPVTEYHYSPVAGGLQVFVDGEEQPTTPMGNYAKHIQDFHVRKRRGELTFLRREGNRYDNGHQGFADVYTTQKTDNPLS